MDESWKDSYDEWKLRSPYDEHPYYDDEEADGCLDHDYDDLDPATGRRTCMCCGHFYYPTTEQLEREELERREYEKRCRREERRARYARWFGGLAFWKRWRRPKPITDDDIPF